jgi:hypothetical protein
MTKSFERIDMRTGTVAQSIHHATHQDWIVLAQATQRKKSTCIIKIRNINVVVITAIININIIIIIIIIITVIIKIIEVRFSKLFRFQGPKGAVVAKFVNVD